MAPGRRLTIARLLAGVSLATFSTRSQAVDAVQLLKDLRLRRTALPGQVLRIARRRFDIGFRLEDYELEHTEFERCTFSGSTMLRGILRHVHFKHCTFDGNTIGEGEWHDVTFTNCSARGPFLMGTPKGSGLVFDDCTFTGGATAGQISYGGIGGGAGPVRYQRCRFTRMFINGGASLHIDECALHDVVIGAQDNAAVDIARVTAQGNIQIGGKTSVFATVQVRKSAFQDGVSFDNTSVADALIEDTTGGVDLTRVKAGHIVLRRVRFAAPPAAKEGIEYGLHTTSARIQSLRVEDCSFESARAALFFSGRRPRHNSAAGAANPYATHIDKLHIEGTPLTASQFKYARIASLTIEDAAMQGGDFSSSAIENLTMKNVSISGKIVREGTLIGTQTKVNVRGSLN